MTPLQIALMEYGNQGYPGPSRNPNVMKYYAEIGAGWVQDDDIAWCAAFLNWVLMKAGLKYSSSLMARDFMKYGIATTAPKLGDIVVLWRGSKDSIYGHVGIYISSGISNVYILGGNQSNRVSVDVYPKTQVLGYRTYLTK